jgi:hypothetical protein
MKTYDLHNNEGQIIGFEISNVLVGRWRACRVARGIPGAQVIRWPRRWAWRDDRFCHFDLHGVRFVIQEPFGDNSRYCICADPPAPGLAVMHVRAAFADASMFDWRFRAAGR